MTESRSRSSSRPDLPVELHQATRAEHASLNRAIVARLPLCLPPHVSNPLAYTAGMIVFSHVYAALEESWNVLLHEDNEYKLDSRQRELLLALQTQCIPRTERLRHDLRNLKRSLDPHTTQFLESLHTKTQNFHSAIRDSIRTKPHIMLAYTWTMYLALFNGGRWIVRQLMDSDPSYWFNEQDEEVLSEKYLSFWFFDETPRDEHHGETVKIDFKRNFNAAANSLNDAEKDDVISETKALFNTCADMVALLDQEMSQIGALECSDQKRGTAISNTLSSYLLTVLPVTHVWQSLRAVVGYAVPKQPAPIEDTTKA